MLVDTAPRPAVSNAARAGWPWPALSALIAIAAVVLQCRIGLDSDVAWLLTVGERVLDGAELYRDIFEVNPPASVLIYLPGIAAARALGLSAEFATATFVFLLAAATIGFSGRLLINGGLMPRSQRLPGLTAASFCFLLLPCACFAQREHIALLALLPMVAVQTLRAEGHAVGRAAAIVAGVGAGMTMAIKPHLLLAVAPLLLWTLWRRRSLLTVLGPESWSAGAVVLLYLAAIVTLFPAFFTEAVPLVSAVYVPAGSGIHRWLFAPAMQLLLVAAILSLLMLRGRADRSNAPLPLLAASGFAAAAALQGRGYLNHLYPALALALFALLLVLIESKGERGPRRIVPLGALLVAGAAMVISTGMIHPELAALVRKVAPPRPSIIVAGSDLSVGHPLTRWVDGRWVGRRASLWVSGCVTELLDTETDPAVRARLEAYRREDLRMFAEDVSRARPDVVLLPESSGTEWMRSEPAAAQALSSYRRAGTAEGVHVLLRITAR